MLSITHITFCQIFIILFTYRISFQHAVTSSVSRMPLHSCCEMRVMQMHDILLLRISAILPEAISDGGLTLTTDTDLLLATYRGGSHLTSDINL